MPVPSAVLRRRLSWLELPLLAGLLYLFYLITDRKDIGYAAGGIIALGIAALAFFRPRWGLVISMLILFVTTTLNQIMAVAQAAKDNDLTGLPVPLQNAWFLWGSIVIYAVMLLAYLTNELQKGAKWKPLSGIEWALLMPIIMSLFYFPISMIYGLDYSNFVMDVIPFLLYAGVVIISRLFREEGNDRESRYFFLDWFIVFNFLILIPLWFYNIRYDPWRNANVGISAIRYGTGPYDYNFFLVPLLGMILTYDDNLKPARRGLYLVGFFGSLVRVIVSLFRGAMAGTLLSILLLAFLTDRTRRWRLLKMFVIFALVAVLLGSFLVATVPVVRATFNVALVRRVQSVVSEKGSDKSLQFRRLELYKVWDDIQRRPIFGYGPGSMIVKNFNLNENARVELYIHSAYAWFWYKMGILGLMTLLIFFLGIYGTCIKLLLRSLHPPDRGWVLGTLAATVSMLPVIQTNNMLVRAQGAFSLMLLLFGLCMIVSRYQGIPRDQLPSPQGDEA
jgi:O-antigen ligase